MSIPCGNRACFWLDSRISEIPVNECIRCPALCASRNQIVMPTAATVGGLLAIGEAPGEKEDEMGVGFAGQAGKTLDRLLAEHGIGREGYGRANICRCRPPVNRKPTRAEVDACMPYLAEFIEQTRPRVLLLVGGTAAAHIVGTGSLARRIEMSRSPGGTWVDPAMCHPALRSLAAQRGLLAVPMPHTSGLAWNRKTPAGEPWSEVGKRQVALAVELAQREG